MTWLLTTLSAPSDLAPKVFPHPLCPVFPPISPSEEASQPVQLFITGSVINLCLYVVIAPPAQREL